MLDHIPVSASWLRHAHGEISRKFLHGHHSGATLRDTISGLRSGRSDLKDFPPLLVAEIEMSAQRLCFVIYGNRRLDCARNAFPDGTHRGVAQKIPAIVVKDYPKLRSLPATLRMPFILKCMKALDTENEGTACQVRPSRHMRATTKTH